MLPNIIEEWKCGNRNLLLLVKEIWSGKIIIYQGELCNELN